MSLDYLYLLSIFIPFWLVLLLPAFLSETSPATVPHLLDRGMIPAYVVIGIFIIAVLNKDFFQGRSVVKRILGYQLVDAATEEVASDWQCCVRNLTVLMWPIEVAAAFIHPQRRIGDFLAGTRLKEIEPIDPRTILEDAKEKTFHARSIWALIVSAGMGALFPLWIMLVEHIMFR
jgi:hypothetical protein